ncbi:putative bifunctional diguanylate cyclase/phosphodiesterase [Marinomonas pollencensis]|uniref:PAS domain S-box-containing protein/diguanylate cyclase (GGDEF)-like protein n=1 Tax=Marinomonas pollencensis TaxID=491954 RepID=A0A3E0DEA4_9GAMM|nr:EAL domain-containing protein [Marinomonas pollencensis]REG81009.1 PAS domain S-box-containing protein/diguanylate cyclase (GGDEF)-like protein [Marinomonas pollencensis]
MLALRKRLSYKQAKWALGLMLLLSVVMSSFQIFSDWREEKASIHQRITAAFNAVESATTEAAYTLNSRLAEQILTGLIQSNVFREVTLKDDLDNQLAYLYRPAKASPFQWISEFLFSDLTKNLEFPLQYDNQLTVGTVIGVVDVGAVTSSFVSRSLRLMGTILVMTLLFGVAMMTLFYLQTSRPLNRFIAKLSLLSDNTLGNDTLKFEEASRNDELGVLARTFLALWHQQKYVENKLEKSEAYFKAVLHQSSECMLLANLKGRILDCNSEACYLLGYDQDALLTLNIQDIDPRHRLPSVAVDFKEAEEVQVFESEFLRSDGHYIPVEVRSNVISLDGKPHFLASMRDITERKKDQEKVKYLAYYDALTELPNRRFFNERLEQAVDNATHLGVIGGLLFIDLDRFKNVNDSFGHHAGDTVLVRTAKRVQALLSEQDMVARIGGDEFVALLPDLSSDDEKAREKVTRLANEILTALSRPIHLNHTEILLSASIGISLFPLEQSDAMSILQKADTAMYQAKESGRGSLYFYNDEMRNSVAERLAMEKALHYALERDEFYLVYQPQVDGNGNILGFEALLRWHSKELGQVPPSRFIPIAEETGFIAELGQWVLDTACQQLKKWQEAGLPPLFKALAINISPSQFAKDSFVETIEQVIERTCIDPSLLDLEITEGMLVESISSVAAKMRSLKKQQVHFSIDDFGTGYSSLRYLQHLPLDQLKIDQSFVRDISHDPNSHVIINTIVSMARHMNLSVLAEGVEYVEEKNILTGIGCTRFQGYYFSRPVDVQSATNLLANASCLPLELVPQEAEAVAD